MINLVQSPFGMQIPNMTIDGFVEKFKGYVNEDLIKFLVKDEDVVEVTYSPERKNYRFDFVDVKSIIKDNSFNSLDNYFLNIDVNLNECKIKVLIDLSTLGTQILYNENRKDEIISKYTKLKSDLKNIGFYLEMFEDTENLCLVSNNLKGLTVDELSQAINIVEDYTKSLGNQYV